MYSVKELEDEMNKINDLNGSKQPINRRKINLYFELKYQLKTIDDEIFADKLNILVLKIRNEIYHKKILLAANGDYITDMLDKYVGEIKFYYPVYFNISNKLFKMNNFDFDKINIESHFGCSMGHNMDKECIQNYINNMHLTEITYCEFKYNLLEELYKLAIRNINYIHSTVLIHNATYNENMDVKTPFRDYICTITLFKSIQKANTDCIFNFDV